MGTCKYCGDSKRTISDAIGFCADCIRNHFDAVWPEIKKVHDHSRKTYGLPTDPPRSENGISCSFCVHGCMIPDGRTGYCGLRMVKGGTIRGGRPHEGNLYYYHDPLPTNCVADFVCPAGTGCGYPRYAVSDGPEYGYRNLAVFYHACSFNCLYCQNYHFKVQTRAVHRVPAKELAAAVDEKTTCICYFGGDPTPQVLHAIKTSRSALKRAQETERILRICWETNGAVQELSLESGGCIKFDLKAWDEGLHYALCGVTNKQTLYNFRVLSEITRKRTVPPFLIASTLLVPGYIDEMEVGKIARYIADLNPEIPYSLLAFYPQFHLQDLPFTSRGHALRCKEAAEKMGLNNVHLGNVH
ncbi:MAG: radical SAM protein, partial [Deltaproteobacteria bacterium]|nr:radical SAM protein [Deltaproteobacteria bacterium]